MIGGKGEDASSAADASGNAYVAGWIQGAFDPGTGDTIDAGDRPRLFVARIDPAGATTLFSTFGGPEGK